MLTPEDRSWLLERHVWMSAPRPGAETICNACARTWPCPTVEAITALILAEQDRDAARADVDRLRAALLEIRTSYGRVCPEYELCTHAACASSYGAWATADIALAGEGAS